MSRTPHWQHIAGNCPGYMYDEELPRLQHWASVSPGPLVEIGSFAGKSLLWIASNAEHPVISIDPHRGNPEMHPGGDCFIEEAWDDKAGKVDSLPLLRRTIEDADMADKVTLIAAPSLQVASWWTTPIGFLFIDGDHGPAAQDDYRAWNQHLMPGGILCFHDTGISHVEAAVNMALADQWHERETVRSCLKVLTR
jgi:predicted O-methyltransferase YrrM